MNKNFSLKEIVSWCFFDWGISSFSVIVTTFVFATYFTSKIAVNEIIGTQQWGNAMAIAGILIAVFCPVLGAIADYSGRKKYWLAIFVLMLIISTTLLWFAYPTISSTYFTLACVITGTVALNLCMVFYNALLRQIAPPDYLGRISGYGWGLGYFGGLVILFIIFTFFVNSHPSWLNASALEQVRISGPLVAVWIMLFVTPLFIFVKDRSSSALPLHQAISSGLKDLLMTFRKFREQKNTFTFLIAQMIYIDGLNTLFAFAGIYAAGTFQMSLDQILLFGIVMNLFAGIGSLTLSWIDDRFGPKITILLSLIFLTGLGLGIVIINTTTGFWILAALMSLFIGPVQSSSRTLMTQLIPKEKATQMFGLYVLSGKITTFIGPFVLGSVTLLFNSQRMGMASILVFFVIGFFILQFVKPKA